MKIPEAKRPSEEVLARIHSLTDKKRNASDDRAREWGLVFRQNHT